MTTQQHTYCLLTLLTLLCANTIYARSNDDADNTAPDSIPIYQGINLKLDIGNTIFCLAQSHGHIQSYEAAINALLLSRYLPTLELGYEQAKQLTAQSGNFSNKGGFTRIGLDISALPKSGTNNMLLVGLRLSTAVQQYQLSNITIADPYWQTTNSRNFNHLMRADLWGEIVAGVQVQIYKNLNFGWYARLKILFTRKENGKPTPYYIPGFGYREDTNFSFNYYIGIQL